jgi:hypothetical protein
MRLTGFMACLLAVCLPLSVAPGWGAEPSLSEAAGTVTSWDNAQQLLNVNTRLGPKVFRLSRTTVVLLNNHSATEADITVNDQATVTYSFDTSAATVVHLSRETRQQARVTSVSATAIDLSFSGATLTVRPNTSSRVELMGIPLADRSVLVGRKAVVIYEPGTLTLLSLAGKAGAVSGRLSKVDAATARVTLAGKKGRVFTVAANATLLRSGKAAALSALAVGDRVRLAYVGRESGARVLALAATPRK